MPTAAVVRPDTQGPVDWVRGETCGRGIVSIDTGVKAFATCYDPEDGSMYKWGDRPWLLAWLSRKRDRLVAKAMDHHGQSRRRILKVATGIGRHITNLVSELHRKLSPSGFAVVLRSFSCPSPVQSSAARGRTSHSEIGARSGRRRRGA